MLLVKSRGTHRILSFFWERNPLYLARHCQALMMFDRDCMNPASTVSLEWYSVLSLFIESCVRNKVKTFFWYKGVVAKRWEKLVDSIDWRSEISRVEGINKGRKGRSWLVRFIWFKGEYKFSTICFVFDIFIESFSFCSLIISPRIGCLHQTLEQGVKDFCRGKERFSWVLMGVTARTFLICWKPLL